MTIADLKLAGVRATRFVYPDPPLSEGELRRLEVLDGRLTVTTPLLLLATEARSADRADPATSDSAGPTPRLEGHVVGLSVGNSDDLGRCGMGEQHLNEAAVSFARYLLACGADLAYGGIPDLAPLPAGAGRPNFLELLLEMIRARNKYVPGRAGGAARLRSYVAEAFADQLGSTFRSRWKPVIDVQVVPAGVAPPPGDTVERKAYTARSLTAMRAELARRTTARVLLGGRSFGFAGRYPGLVEEAYLALAGPRPQPVYLIGAFGGAARG